MNHEKNWDNDVEIVWEKKKKVFGEVADGVEIVCETSIASLKKKENDKSSNLCVLCGKVFYINGQKDAHTCDVLAAWVRKNRRRINLHVKKIREDMREQGKYVISLFFRISIPRLTQGIFPGGLKTTENGSSSNHRQRPRVVRKRRSQAAKYFILS